MGQQPVYEVGAPVPQRIGWSFDLRQQGIRGVGLTMTARCIEFWCASHCSGAWRVEQTHVAVTVSFEADTDAVHFKLGPIYHQHSDVALKC